MEGCEHGESWRFVKINVEVKEMLEFIAWRKAQEELGRGWK